MDCNIAECRKKKSHFCNDIWMRSSVELWFTKPLRHNFWVMHCPRCCSHKNYKLGLYITLAAIFRFINKTDVILKLINGAPFFFIYSDIPVKLRQVGQSSNTYELRRRLGTSGPILLLLVVLAYIIIIIVIVIIIIIIIIIIIK